MKAGYALVALGGPAMLIGLWGAASAAWATEYGSGFASVAAR